MRKKYFDILKEFLIISSLILFGIISIIFSFLYLEMFESGFFYENKKLCESFVFLVVFTITILSIIFFRSNKDFVYKLFLIIIAFISLFFVCIYILKKVGILDRFSTVDSFREYIADFGAKAWIIFILIQFLQVVVLPIPAFITVGAGVLLFGPFLGGLYSSIGIILGSLVAFFIGRVFGYKVAKWLVGKNALDKGLKAIKGKDKVILTFMFLFPFFPDDVLCFVSGITTISPLFFVIMIFITRLISIFISTYSMNNSLIPYNTWWGIIIWCFIFASVIFISYLVIKHGEKIEKFFKKILKRKNE